MSRPLERVHAGDECLEAARCWSMKSTSRARPPPAAFSGIVHVEQRLRHADKYRKIAARIELVILRADLRLRQRQHLDGDCGLVKSLEAAFA